MNGVGYVLHLHNLAPPHSIVTCTCASDYPFQLFVSLPLHIMHILGWWDNNACPTYQALSNSNASHNACTWIHGQHMSVKVWLNADHGKVP